MKTLLAFSRLVDGLSDRFAWIAKWAVVISCLISAGNAVVRYGLDYSSNAWLEIQWYLFAACVMLGAAQVMRVNEHVRVDLLYSRLSGRGQALLDLAGFTLFVLPTMVVMIWYAWPLFLGMLRSGEMSGNIGGLIRWPAMAMLPLGFALLLLQALSEIIKRVAWLRHEYHGDFHYERPLQ
ncbi:TRAP transporter small permease subunit [Piscinibacter sp.]|uniref:TRAP transporter small permease subunit n=1 Tax=Piscinibacter sp. TaxID=1903157 RepID=UPI0039E3AA2A